MASFNDILNKPAAEIEAPKPHPAGTYLAIIDGPGEFTKMGKDQTDVLKVKFKLMQAGPDVDAEALAAAESLGKTITANYFLTDAAIYRLKEMMEHAGLELGTKSVGQLIPELPGQQINIVIGHRPSADGQRIFAEVKATAAV
jgi:hypothetical protein